MSLTLQVVAVSLKPAIEGIQALIKLVSGDAAKAQASQLYDIIIAAQARDMESLLKQTAMIDRIRELEEKLREKEAWDSKKIRYGLYSPHDGTYVRALKENTESAEPPHWICTKCYEDSKISILQRFAGEMRTWDYKCPECRAVINLRHSTNIVPQYIK